MSTLLHFGSVVPVDIETARDHLIHHGVTNYSGDIEKLQIADDVVGANFLMSKLVPHQIFSGDIVIIGDPKLFQFLNVYISRFSYDWLQNNINIKTVHNFDNRLLICQNHFLNIQRGSDYDTSTGETTFNYSMKFPTTECKVFEVSLPELV